MNESSLRHALRAIACAFTVSIVRTALAQEPVPLPESPEPPPPADEPKPPPAPPAAETPPPASEPSVTPTVATAPIAGWRQGLFFLRDPDDYFRLYVQGRVHVDNVTSFGPGLDQL